MPLKLTEGIVLAGCELQMTHHARLLEVLSLLNGNCLTYELDVVVLDNSCQVNSVCKLRAVDVDL